MAIVFVYGLYHVRIRKLPLRRTANLDIALLKDTGEMRKRLEPALNGFIAIEAAFASVTAGILFVFVGLFSTSGAAMDPVDATIAKAAATALGLATIVWILSLEQLSHMVSPSLVDDRFCTLYMEAFNLWNLGLFLLMFSISMVLILVDPAVSIAVTIISTFLSMRSLCLIHGWEVTKLPPRSKPVWLERLLQPIARMMKLRLPVANQTISYLLLFAMLLPLYWPLNIAREPMHNVGLAIDRLIPFVPIFAIPYLSYFPFLLITAIVLRKQGGRLLDEWLFAGCITLAVAYLVYGFFQTAVPRPDISHLSGWSISLVKTVYGNDNPYNAMPSLHTALSVLSALAVGGGKGIKAVWWGWALMIVASTLLVKQHYILDALTGGLLAALSLWLSRSSIRQEPTAETSSTS